MIDSFYDFFANDFFLNGFSAFLGGIISGGCAILGARMSLSYKDREKLPDKIIDLVQLRRDIIILCTFFDLHLKKDEYAPKDLDGYSDPNHSMSESLAQTFQNLLRVAVRVDTITYNAVTDLIIVNRKNNELLSLDDFYNDVEGLDIDVLFRDGDRLNRELSSKLVLITERLRFYENKLEKERMSKWNKFKNIFLRD